MICAILILCQTPASHGPDPGPRTALGGSAGFQSVSRIDFDGGSNRLTAAYVFPDRARWHFESYSARVRSEHQYFYRLGERLRLFEGSPSSALEGGARDGLILQMELRRAVMFWPDGFAWSEASDTSRSAAIYLDSCCREGSLGTLHATIENGRPACIEARDRHDQVVETFEIQAWQEVAGRHWPRSMTMKGAQGSFTETVESIEPAIHFLEVSFLPPDQRPVPVSPGKGPRVLARDIVAMTLATLPIPTGTSWEGAEGLARSKIQTATESLAGTGLEVDTVPTFEVDSDGLPARILLRLAAPCRSPPPGFQTLAERPGLFLLLETQAEVGPAVLRRLLDAVPAEARPGTPYVRLHPRKEVPVELVLPIGPGR